MNTDLKKWLETPCDKTDLLQLEKDVFYMPIGTVKKKIQYMEDTFNVSVNESAFSHLLFNKSQKEIIASGSIVIRIFQWEGGQPVYLITELIGTATFPVDNYGENTHYAATLESLCIVNAFGGKYPQFGSALNKIDVVPDTKVKKAPVADTSNEMAQVFKMLKTKLKRFKFREDAQAYLDTTEYKTNLEAKSIVNLLPLKK